MSSLKPILSHIDNIHPSTPGKFKPDKSPFNLHLHRFRLITTTYPIQLTLEGLFIRPCWRVFIDGDLNDAVLVRKVFWLVHVTHVLHLAAQAGVRYAMANPGSYIKSNVDAFVNLLEVVKAVNPQPVIIWASSSLVYRLNSKVPFSEKDRTNHPASLYAATKKAGEEIAHSYNYIYGLSITGLRFFTVYGSWSRPDMAYFFSLRRGGGAQFRVINLGNTNPVSVSKLVSILEKLLKVKAKKVVLMPRNGDVLFTHANISLARKELGYNPVTDLETGLRKFVKWYVEYYGGKKKSSW